MLKITEYVNASEIWEYAQDHVDKGEVLGLVRGYNVEVQLKDGSTDWWSCEWIYGDPETEFNDDFHTYMYSDRGVTPTGRICFRGYGEEMYDPSERDYYVVAVADDYIKVGDSE